MKSLLWYVISSFIKLLKLVLQSCLLWRFPIHCLFFGRQDETVNNYGRSPISWCTCMFDRMYHCIEIALVWLMVEIRYQNCCSHWIHPHLSWARLQGGRRMRVQLSRDLRHIAGVVLQHCLVHTLANRTAAISWMRPRRWQGTVWTKHH